MVKKDNEYLKDIENFLRAYRYEIEREISDNLFKIENIDKVLRITNNQSEIDNYRLRLNFKSRQLSNVYIIKDWGDFHIIVMDYISDVNYSVECTLDNLFSKLKMFNFFNKGLKYIKVKLTLEVISYFLSRDELYWLAKINLIKKQCDALNIESPNGYHIIKNLGFKSGDLSCYKINNDKSSNFLNNFLD